MGKMTGGTMMMMTPGTTMTGGTTMMTPGTTMTGGMMMMTPGMTMTGTMMMMTPGTTMTGGMMMKTIPGTMMTGGTTMTGGKMTKRKIPGKTIPLMVAGGTTGQTTGHHQTGGPGAETEETALKAEKHQSCILHT